MARHFGVDGDHFVLDGKPIVLRCGEMHYPRVPREYWRDRMRKMRALGLNSLCTYLFWNLHEPREGLFDFSGNLDVAEYVRIAQEEGLLVLVRPGPYICTEWDFGGLPGWLVADDNMVVRSAHKGFVAASDNYMRRVGQELAPLQVTHGGPIVMVQVENEYGSYAADKVYLGAIRDQVIAAGFEVPLYTSDGPSDEMLAGGTLPDCLSVINFGGGDPASQFEHFDRFRQGVPRMCGEYWIGWFLHWGETYSPTNPEDPARGVDWMLSQGVSFSLYMVHGGSSFGYMAGANFFENYTGDISSYDYDSPLDEAGRPTPKYHLIREAIRKHLPADEALPGLPEPLPAVAIEPFELHPYAAMLDPLPVPVPAEQPIAMEKLGQDYGFVLYRHRAVRVQSGTLQLPEVRDYAILYVDGERIGKLDRRHAETSMEITLKPGSVLDILVENMARVNFGARLADERKGLSGPVTLDGEPLQDWEVSGLPLHTPPAAGRGSVPAAPAFHRGAFTVAELGDTFFDLGACGKGHAYLNGRHLGRYWSLGPQQCLFAPASWLRVGENELVVLDVEEREARSARGLTSLYYETRPEAEA